MDRATGAPEGNSEEPEAGRPPSIGVPSIPAQAAQHRTPVSVPSVPVPSPDPEESTEPSQSWTEIDADPTAGESVAPDDPTGRADTGPSSVPKPSRARPRVPVVSTR